MPCQSWQEKPTEIARNTGFLTLPGTIRSRISLVLQRDRMRARGSASSARSVFVFRLLGVHLRLGVFQECHGHSKNGNYRRDHFNVAVGHVGFPVRYVWPVTVQCGFIFSLPSVHSLLQGSHLRRPIFHISHLSCYRDDNVSCQRFLAVNHSWDATNNRL